MIILGSKKAKMGGVYNMMKKATGSVSATEQNPYSTESQVERGGPYKDQYNTASEATWKAFKDAIGADDYKSGMRALQAMMSMASSYRDGDSGDDY